MRSLSLVEAQALPLQPGDHASTYQIQYGACLVGVNSNQDVLASHVTPTYLDASQAPAKIDPLLFLMFDHLLHPDWAGTVATPLLYVIARHEHDQAHFTWKTAQHLQWHLKNGLPIKVDRGGYVQQTEIPVNANRRIHEWSWDLLHQLKIVEKYLPGQLYPFFDAYINHFGLEVEMQIANRGGRTSSPSFNQSLQVKQLMIHRMVPAA